MAYSSHFEGPNWFRRFKEISPSTFNPSKYDHPVESVEWLKHFSSQNGTLLQMLNVSLYSILGGNFITFLINRQLKTTQHYTWSKREVTEKGVPLTELINLGCKYECDVI